LGYHQPEKDCRVPANAKLEIVFDVYQPGKTRDDFQISYSKQTALDIQVNTDETRVRLIVYLTISYFQNDWRDDNVSYDLGLANAIFSNPGLQNHPTYINITPDFYPPGIYTGSGSGVLQVKTIGQ
jgi:hypothetical protein